MRKSFFILAVLVCTLLSCSKHEDVNRPDDPNQPNEPTGTTLSLSTNDLVFEAAGGWKEFTINCSDAWTLTGGNAWCQPGATSGSGRTQVKVMVEASTLTSDRNVNLTVRCGSQSKVLAVTQKGVNALTLTKDKFEMAAEGGDLTVTLQANVECTSTIPSAFQSWIKKSPDTKAMTSQSFRYTVSPNEDTQKREGYIVFSGGSKKDTVYVYQSAKIPAEESSLILSENTYDLSASAQEITVELKTNIDYEVIVPDTVETWVSYITTRAIRTDKLHFSIAENEGDDARSAVVIIKEQNGELTDTLYIRQAEQSVLMLETKIFQVSSAGETIKTKLTTNIDYDVVIPDTIKSWIAYLGARANHMDELRFFIDENETHNSRIAVVVIQERNGKLTDTLHFIQEKGRVIILEEKQFTLPLEGGEITVEIKKNKEYEIINECAWIQVMQPTEGVLTDVLNFRIVANNDADNRSTEILVRDKNSRLDDTIRIIQEGSHIFMGNILLFSNYDVADLKKKGYTQILGYVTVYENVTSLEGLEGLTYIEELSLFHCTNLYSLKGLENLENIGRRFNITECNNITSLVGLENLKSIGGDFSVDCNLTSFVGLKNLRSIGGTFRIEDRQSSLTSFAGLENLRSIGWLYMKAYSGAFNSLTSIADLKNVEMIGGLYLEGLRSLTSLSGLEHLSNCSGIRLENLPSLVSIAALKNVRSVTEILSLRDLPLITSLSDLKNLTTVSGNFYLDNMPLESLSGLENLEVVGSLYFANMPSLTSIAALKNIKSDMYALSFNNLSSLTSLYGLNNARSIINEFRVRNCTRLSSYCDFMNALENISGTYDVRGNAYNPTKTQMLKGECSK